MTRCGEQGITFDPHFGESKRPQFTEFEMRVFIVLALVAAAHADVGGYNYGSGPSSGGALLSGSIGGAGGDALLGGSLGSGGDGGSGGNGGGSLGGLIGGGDGGDGGSLGGPSGGSAADLGHESSLDAGPAEVEKEFFTFSAPEADFNDDRGLNDLASSVKKSLRVIFIKGPENDGLSRAALNLARSAGDSKTAVYILQKQADLGSLAQQLQNLKSQANNKPEVHFVKYRTPEDASQAQQAIRQQYDELGGNSQSHDGGVAPVLNFASKAPAPAPAAAVAPSGGSSGGHLLGGQIGGSNYGQAPANAYVPPGNAGQAPSASYLPIVKF